MSKYKIRFNLGKGENFMKWKVTSPEGNTEYLDPSRFTIIMRNCKLRNQPSTAQKIHDGANKTVCAWIDAEDVEVMEDYDIDINWYNDKRINFNPRKQPNWVYEAEIENLDNKEFSLLTTSGRSVYVLRGWCDE